MQALTATVFPCYAPADRAAAAAIAAFLERGAGVRVFLDEGAIAPGQELSAKARDARMADIALVLFSRASMPSRWPRAAWEAALVTEPAAEGVRIAFARLDDCAPPAVLKPRFELAGLATKGLRALKRWSGTPQPGVRKRSRLTMLPIWKYWESRWPTAPAQRRLPAPPPPASLRAFSVPISTRC